MDTENWIDQKRIEELIEKYRDVLQNKKEEEFNEEDVKNKFINPLLEALGWDVTGINEVKFEQRTLTGRTDIGLRLDQNKDPKIFIEAKKFSENLDGQRRNRTYPEQAINDAWSMKVDWAILTNFKKLRLYYSHVRKPRNGKIFELNFKDFLKEDGKEKLASISKEGVKSGALQRYEKERTREDVNSEFVNDLYSMRKDLIKSVVENNELTTEELKESVQRILDRIVIIRVAEDREIIHSESLHQLKEAWNKTSIDSSFRTLMDDLKNLFRDFDSVYNSEIFAEHKCEDLEIDNNVLKNIIETFYDYNFSLIDADVLGSMYEDYIGHILDEEEEDIKIKENHETRKKSGIYYTPTFVVDYLVNETLGTILQEEPKPEEVEELDILDPACGSGSFLIKAFDYIKTYYQKHNQEIHEKAKESRNPYDFDFKEKEREILKENLYGVDLDEQASEIASVNLMLQGMEKGKKLPLILDENIKTGNSLISRPKEELKDWFENLENESPFLWKKEFSHVFEKGGFDVIIGNPPYVNVSNLEEDQREYFMNSEELKTSIKRFDIYLGFIEKGIEFLKEGGKLGFIIPFPFLNQSYAEELRKYILDTCCIETIVDLSKFEIFKDANVKNILLILKKEKDREVREENKITIIKQKKDPFTINEIKGEKFSIPQDVYHNTYENMFRLDLTQEVLSLLKKIDKNSIRLGDILVASWGARGSPIKDFHYDSKKNSDCKRMIKGEDIERYSINYSGKWLLYDQDELYRPAFVELFENEKLVVSKVTGEKGLIAAYDNDQYYTDDSLCCCIPKHELKEKDDTFFGNHKIDISEKDIKMSKKYNLNFILGIVNSSIVNFYFKSMLGYELNVYPETIEQLALPKLNFNKSQDKKEYDKIIDLIGKIKTLKEQKSWIFSTFENLLSNYDLEEEESLSEFFDPRKPDITKKYGISIAESTRISRSEEGIIREYKVDVDKDSVRIYVRYKDESKFKEVINLVFEDSKIRDYFYLALKRKERKKYYRSDKKVFETTMDDMMVPISTRTNLAEEISSDFKTLVKVLQNNFSEESKKEWVESPIKKVNLAKIEKEIQEIDGQIDAIVFDLYNLNESEVKTVLDSLDFSKDEKTKILDKFNDLQF